MINDFSFNNNIIYLINKLGFSISNINDIEETVIDRNFLLNIDYSCIKDDIPELKKYLKTTYYTSTHSNAESNQQWPIINLLRQILKVYNFKLIPIRVSDGYTLDKKKKYKRLYKIQKIQATN